MTNEYYNHAPQDIVANSRALSQQIDDIGNAVEAGLDKLPTEAQLKNTGVSIGTDSGAANAYVVAMPYTVTSLTDGLLVIFKPSATNTGASTLNVDSLGAKSIKRENGSALSAGDLTINKFVAVRYNSTSDTFDIQTATTTMVTDAETAQTAAETAQTAAETAETNASNSATAASTSASNAATSESNAATSASNASTSETNASTSETNAGNSATSAATSASNASTSETNAASSASSASTSATTATTQAGIATTQATNASASASAASTSESNASTSETNAANSATSAATSATNAASSAAGVNLPSITTGDAGKILAVNSGETAHELVRHSLSTAVRSGLITGTMSVSSTTETLVQSNTTYTGTGASQSINTGIESYDINYVAGDSYSTGDVRFFRDNYKLIEATSTPSEGSELITNGTDWTGASGTTPPTGWTDLGDGATYTITSGQIQITNNGATFGGMYQAISVTANTLYKISASESGGTASGAFITVGATAGTSAIFSSGDMEDTTHEAVFGSGSNTTLYINVYNGSTSGGTGIFDNISVKELVGWEEVADDEVKEHKNSMVWIKQRSGTRSNNVYDTLRGVGNYIYTDATDAETYSPSAITSFNADGFTVGSGWIVNENTETFIAWQQAYHKVFITTTNDSKRALVAFDDVTKRSMVLYQGSGTAGHEIPHGLGVDVNIGTFKKLNDTFDWLVQKSLNGSGNYLFLNLTNAEATHSTLETTTTAENVSINTHTAYNNSGDNYIAYFEANSPNIAVGTYSGTGASGNEIYTGFKPSRVIQKDISGTGNWHIYDNARDADDVLYANVTTAESNTSAITLTSTGFTFDSSTYNDLGLEGLFIAYADTKSNGGSSYSDLPSLTSNLQLSSDAILGYSNGADTYGAVNSAVDVSGTPMPTYSQGANWLKRDASGNWTTTRSEPVIGKPDGFGDFYVDGVWYQPSNLISNGDFQDDISGWTDYSDATLTWQDGKLKNLTHTGTLSIAYQTVTTVSGTTYKFSVDYEVDDTGANSAQVYIGTTIGSANLYNSGSITANNTHVAYFTATGTTTYIQLVSVAIGYHVLFDNVSVTPVDNTSWTPYDPIISYLPYSVQADISGNVAQINDDKLPDVHFDKLSATDVVGQQKPIFKGYLTSNIDGNAEIFPFTTEIDNSNSMNGGIYTIPKSGFYRVVCHALVRHNDATPTLAYAQLVTDNEVEWLYSKGDTSAEFITSSCESIKEYTKGDTVYVISSSVSSTHYFSSGDSSTSLTIEYIGTEFNNDY